MERRYNIPSSGIGGDGDEDDEEDENNTAAANNSHDDSDKYDPAEMYNDEDDDDDDVNGCHDDNNGNPDDNGENNGSHEDDNDEQFNDEQQNYDSDSEFTAETNKRNLNQMKRNLESSSTRNYYSSDSNDSKTAPPSPPSPPNDAFGLGTLGACDVDMRIMPLMVQQPSALFLDNNQQQLQPPKQKRSRWGNVEQPQQQQQQHRHTAQPPPPSSSPRLTALTRNDPALLQYARANYGSVQLTEEEWTKCEEHYKVNLLYQDLLKKRNDVDRLAKSGRFKYEYDSDEDVNGGTWEHKLRNAEMEATAVWSDALTKQAAGKHHIGDFLPPEELKKFMEKYDSQLTNRVPDLSDYREYKLKEDNKGSLKKYCNNC